MRNDFTVKESLRIVLTGWLCGLLFFVFACSFSWFGYDQGILSYDDVALADVYVTGSEYLINGNAPLAPSNWQYYFISETNVNNIVVYDGTLTCNYVKVRTDSNGNNWKYLYFDTSSSTTRGFGYFTAGSWSTNVPSSTGWYTFVYNNGMSFTRMVANEHTVVFSSDLVISNTGVRYILSDLLDPSLTIASQPPQFSVGTTYDIYKILGSIVGNNPLPSKDYLFKPITWDNVPSGDTYVTIEFYRNSEYLSTWQWPVDRPVFIVPDNLVFDSIKYYYPSNTDDYVIETMPGLSSSLIEIINFNTSTYFSMLDDGNGYLRGYNDGYAAGHQDENNLLDIIWAVFDFPFKLAFGEWYDETGTGGTRGYRNGLFTFNILGVDVRALILSFMSILIVVAIVRFILGHKG